jgi:hypothetical protein
MQHLPVEDLGTLLCRDISLRGRKISIQRPLKYPEACEEEL